MLSVDVSTLLLSEAADTFMLLPDCFPLLPDKTEALLVDVFLLLQEKAAVLQHSCLQANLSLQLWLHSLRNFDMKLDLVIVSDDLVSSSFDIGLSISTVTTLSTLAKSKLIKLTSIFSFPSSFLDIEIDLEKSD